MNRELQLKIGKYSKGYRQKHIKINQSELANKYNLDLQNISTFETGRANNILYVLIYATEDKTGNYLKGLIDLFRG